MKKISLIAAVLALAAIIFAGCSGTDVVSKYSLESFAGIVDQYPRLVKDNTQADQYYDFAVDGETVLRISHDYKLTGPDDIMLETPLQPFVDAGLDISKLGEGYKVIDNMLYLTADYGNGAGTKDNVTDALFASVASDRSVLTYHQQLDHYGIKLTAGKFEWAKDYTENDKDIVFVIKAQPLKNLGVDVNNIKGWTYSTVQEADGSNVDVLLKAYDLGK